MQGKVEIAGVNTAKLKVLKSSETMELLRRSLSTTLCLTFCMKVMTGVAKQTSKTIAATTNREITG